MYLDIMFASVPVPDMLSAIHKLSTVITLRKNVMALGWYLCYAVSKPLILFSYNIIVITITFSSIL